MKTETIVKIDKTKLAQFLKNLVMNRYDTKSDIEKEIEMKTNLKLKLEEKSRDEFEKEFDYCFITDIEIYDMIYCHIDIDYLLDNGGKILITGTYCDFNT